MFEVQLEKDNVSKRPYQLCRKVQNDAQTTNHTANILIYSQTASNLLNIFTENVIKHGTRRVLAHTKKGEVATGILDQ